MLNTTSRLILAVLVSLGIGYATCLTDNSDNNGWQSSAVSFFSGTAEQDWTFGTFQNTSQCANFDLTGSLGDLNFNDEAGNLSAAAQCNTTQCGGGPICGHHAHGTASSAWTTTNLGFPGGSLAVTHPNFAFWYVRKNSASDQYESGRRALNTYEFTIHAAAGYTQEHTGGTDPAVWQFSNFRAARSSYNFVYKGYLPDTIVRGMSRGFWPHNSANFVLSPCWNGSWAGWLSSNHGAIWNETGTITDGGHAPGIAQPFEFF